MYIFRSRTYAKTVPKAGALRGHSLEASVCPPLCSRLSRPLLQLLAELLGVRVLQGFDRHRRLGPSLPLDTTLIHHRGLHSDGVSAQDGEIQQELDAEVVVVGFHLLLDLISFSVEWNLKKGKNVSFNTWKQRAIYLKRFGF